MQSSIDRPVGLSIFGTDALGYEAGRLSYPDELFDLLADRCGLGDQARLFEIGPGSGQATRGLLARGAKVTAIEPDPSLARLLAEKCPDRSPHLKIHVSPFETVDLPSGTFDLGVAATSFGWLEPKVGLAKAVQLLKPGGWWAMWWNVFRDIDGDPIFDTAMAGVSRPPAFKGNDHYSLSFHERLAELREAGLTDAEYLPLTRRLSMTPAALRALYATFSVLRTLPEADMDRRLIATEEMAQAEAINGLIERSFVTPIYIARRNSQVG